MKDLTQYQLQQVMLFHPDQCIAQEARDLVRVINAGKQVNALRDKSITDQRSADRAAALQLCRERQDVVRKATGIRSPLVICELEQWISRGKTGKVRGVFQQGRAKAINRTEEVLDGMRALGATSIKIGNDAPRGGQCGWYAE